MVASSPHPHDTVTGAPFTESIVEEASLSWLAGLGWAVRPGPELAPGEPGSEREDYGQVVLSRRLRAALARLNSGLPPEARESAFRKLLRPEGSELVRRNRATHRMLEPRRIGPGAPASVSRAHWAA